MISVPNCLNAMYRISCFDNLYISIIHIISSNYYHLSRPEYSICDSDLFFLQFSLLISNFMSFRASSYFLSPEVRVMFAKFSGAILSDVLKCK